MKGTTLNRYGTYLQSAFTILFLSLCSAAPLHAELDPAQLFLLNKPGTVVIQAKFSAELSVPTPDIQQNKTEALVRRVVARARRGEIAGDRATIMKTALEEVLMNWPDYIISTEPTRRLEVTIAAMGSGFCITPDGYLITNAHVASPTDDELKQEFASYGLSKFVDEDMSDVIDTWKEEVGGPPPESVVKLVDEAAAEFYAEHMTIRNLEREVFTCFALTPQQHDEEPSGIPTQVVKAGRAAPGKDIALLKAEASALPALALGDDSALTTGGRIYVIGFPAAATFHPFLAKDLPAEPTFTSGIVSARKSMPGGWEVLQVDAEFTHGNSGGPVLDSDGKVVGIATFGSADPDTGQALAGMNFVVPISVVRQFLMEAAVEPDPGPVTALYAQALEQNQRHQFSRALKTLHRLEMLAPGRPFVQTQMTVAEQGIKESPASSALILPLALGFLVVVLALALGWTLMKTRWQRR